MTTYPLSARHRKANPGFLKQNLVPAFSLAVFSFMFVPFYWFYALTQSPGFTFTVVAQGFPLPYYAHTPYLGGSGTHMFHYLNFFADLALQALFWLGMLYLLRRPLHKLRQNQKAVTYALARALGLVAAILLTVMVYQMLINPMDHRLGWFAAQDGHMQFTHVSFFQFQ